MAAIAPDNQPPAEMRIPRSMRQGEPQPWMAAIAIIPILATVYQTLVLTDLAGDVIRLGINGDEYQMIWTTACWGIAVLYGVFIGIWSMARFGARDTLLVGLVWFALGNLFCGASMDVASLAGAKLVEGIGKGMVLVLCRSMLYRQFEKTVIVAIGIYGVLAYATRPATPLLTAYINDALSWRWVFWVNVPLTLLAIPLVRRFIRRDRPPKPLPLRIDWIAVTMLSAWLVTLVFVCGWYRKWGGWTSDAFAATSVCAIGLPVVLAAWVGSGFSASEHFQRMVRVRVYVLAMFVRMLLLVQLLAVLALMAKYCTELRDYPRVVSGWVLAPASVAMALTTFLTTRFRRRSLRHVWLLVAALGCAGSLWWMSGVDAFTSKHQVALMIGCWGLFVGLIPPVFLQDEVEALDRRDALYGGALAIVFLVVPMIIVPSMTSTIVSAWTDRAVDAERANLSRNRPEVVQATVRVAGYYESRGVAPQAAQQAASTVLAGFVETEAASRGIQSGLAWLSLIVGGLGTAAALLLFWWGDHAAG